MGEIPFYGGSSQSVEDMEVNLRKIRKYPFLFASLKLYFLFVVVPQESRWLESPRDQMQFGVKAKIRRH